MDRRRTSPARPRPSYSEDRGQDEDRPRHYDDRPRQYYDKPRQYYDKPRQYDDKPRQYDDKPSPSYSEVSYLPVFPP